MHLPFVYFLCPLFSFCSAVATRFHTKRMLRKILLVLQIRPCESKYLKRPSSMRRVGNKARLVPLDTPLFRFIGSAFVCCVLIFCSIYFSFCRFFLSVDGIASFVYFMHKNKLLLFNHCQSSCYTFSLLSFVVNADFASFFFSFALLLSCSL